MGSRTFVHSKYGYYGSKEPPVRFMSSQRSYGVEPLTFMP